MHIIGIGAVGSHVANLLVRSGFENIHLYDYDEVKLHNISNQMYDTHDLEVPKNIATCKKLKAINPSATVVLRGAWDEYSLLDGHVFLCVDDIEVRKRMVTMYMNNPAVETILDFRIGYTKAQHYAAKYGDYPELYNTMDFTKEEAQENQPVSPCNSKMTALPTIQTITALGVANFLNIINENSWATMILIDSFEFEIIKIIKT
jgi:hypothetical protein